MKSIILITLLLVFLYILYINYRTTIEGFLETPKIDNALLNVMAKLKRVSGYLSDPKSWIERITLANMSSVELARHYIKSQKKDRDA